ncbi:MAG: hypothetical protein JWN98_310 [Abditibacteriota bacterium]|nr:hypothetical protein [Abditibacteriota bacterium]
MPLRTTSTLLHHLPHHLLFAASLCAFSIGCGKEETAVVPQPKPKPPSRVSDTDLQKYKPNETGAIMVLMYHRIETDEPDNDLNRKPASFRKDLKLLRDGGYHPVTALELVTNTMEVPIGKTPVVITFDDALPSQFKIITGRDGKPHIDPNCAAGIMETFHTEFPEWPTKATFFVLPKAGRNGEPFGQAGMAAMKFEYLAKKGYEIANHTATHDNLRGASSEKIQSELASAVRAIKQISPSAGMQTLALPYGKLPREDSAQKYLISGSSGGITYANKAVFLAAWRPILSPVTRNDKKFSEGGTFSVFNPYRLERIKADAREAKLPGTFEYWLKYFQKNPTSRYVSDGMKDVVAVPASSESAVDVVRLKMQGKRLQVYGGGDGASGGGAGGDLSVE